LPIARAVGTARLDIRPMLTHHPVQLPDLALNAGQLFAERGVMFTKSRHLCAGHALTLPLRD
jgi:hypothetical protein